MSVKKKRRKKRTFKFYWSSLNQYETCPQQFLWKRGWGDIDVGGGPGKPKPIPPEYQDSEHHIIMGNVLAYFWELLYNDEEWRTPEGLLSRMLDKCFQEFERQMIGAKIDWSRSPSRYELWDVIASGIKGFFKTMRHNRLLGEYARSEVGLTAYIDPQTPIGGRVDLVIRRKRSDGSDEILILDGKNGRRYKQGKKWITFTDPDQLRFYALCFYLQHGIMPDKLGFVFYRYPYGQEYKDVDGNLIPTTDVDGVPTGENQIETGIEWVEFTKLDLDNLAARVKAAKKGLENQEFPANPKANYCRMCPFESVCPERKAQKLTNSHKRGLAKDPSLKRIEGFVEFGMEDGKTKIISD